MHKNMHYKKIIIDIFAVTFRKEGVDWNLVYDNAEGVMQVSPSARKVWIEIPLGIRPLSRSIRHLPQGRCGLKLESKVNEYFEYCITFCKWLQFHRFDKEAPPPLGAILQCSLRLFRSFFLYFVTKIRWTINRFLLCRLCW